MAKSMIVSLVPRQRHCQSSGSRHMLMRSLLAGIILTSGFSGRAQISVSLLESTQLTTEGLYFEGEKGETAFSQDVISWPGGRYAITSDGNMHDPDDIGAIPMSIATMCYAGFKDKIVHFDYANHLGLNNPAKLNEITESCTGVAERFGLKNTIVFNCQTQLEAATKNFVKEAKRSSSESPLWFICAGPMGTAYIYLEAVKRADAAKLQYIHCVSHSNANNKHNDTPELEGKTWEAMKRDFPEVTYHDIANQNIRDGFCSPIENWAWMNDESAPEDWKWLYSRNRTASVHVGMFDMSDGGMTYWLISGATNGGNEKGNWDDIRAIFNKAKFKR